MLIPPVCSACHTRLARGEKQLCTDCESKLQPYLSKGCPKCGAPVSNGSCSQCREIGYTFEFVRSALSYQGPALSLVHDLKYNALSSPAGYLADKMAEAVEGSTVFDDYDYLVPVPLHRVRKRERGYNQSELIASKLAHKMGKSYLNCISRTRYTKSQTTLERKERLKNLAGAFRVKNPAMVKGKRLILVDDVYTTGSTLSEASRALYAAGAAKVACYTATRA
ncbi:MAG: ComF family protein [Candidatus Cloacimonetes bacterium]|nr:ComF family protein [Candidatus Cloacimonadota bacterium]MDD2506768.1 ComF family protein [Candidatus Cloacimonadota bacterium]MDD4560256.1 ComF family protein [Candidatus Cloacimonadota bacterium]